MSKIELTLKEIQQESLKILVELKRICNAHGWKFSLAYGTLIGAIRHQGFIPWDDDIDVWMPRSDYEALLSYYRDCPDEFGFLKIFHYSTTDYYPFGIARISDNRYELDYFGYDKLKMGLFVDIYPIDEIDPTAKSFQKKQLFRINSIQILSYRDNSIVKNIIKAVLKPFILMINGTTSIEGLIKKTDKEAQIYNGTGQKFCDVIAWDCVLSQYPNNFLDNIIYVDFEQESMPVVSDYDTVLRTVYGDYMQLPPEKDRIAHHFYKAYRKDI